MRWLAALVGTGMVFVVLWDAFETIVLPRRVNRRVRLTRLFYRSTWRPFAAAAGGLADTRRREAYLSFYGPLSLLVLLSLWAAGVVAGFGLVQYAVGSSVETAGGGNGLATDLYMSGTTFFTLGLGDVVPRGAVGRLLVVVEAGTGFGLLAVVIGYLPIIYQAFSRREAAITLLDARAGSPPTAAELLRRHSGPEGASALERLLNEWEHWSAELLESHLSYPLLAYFRSQHDNESWLAALTTILDTSALLMLAGEGLCARQARLTFAIARHAVVDLSQVFRTPPSKGSDEDRLPPEALAGLRADVAALGFAVEALEADRLAELRRLYEPYASSLSRYLLLPLPGWRPLAKRKDNWQTSAWEPRPPTKPGHF
jgi:Ion channel